MQGIGCLPTVFFGGCWRNSVGGEFMPSFIGFRVSGSIHVVSFGVPLLCSAPPCAMRRKFYSICVTAACYHSFITPSPRVVLWHCSQCISPGFCVVFLSISYVAACSSMALVCIHVLPHTHRLPWPALCCASSTEVVDSDFKYFLASGNWHSANK